MAVNTIGYSAQTPGRLLLDAGAIYKDITYDDLTGDFTGTLLGATSGGNEFVLTQEKREIEVDGVKSRAKGLTVIVREDAQLTVNLKELTAQNIAIAIPGANTDTSDENYDIITTSGKIEMDDYIDSIAYVGRLSGSSKPVVIVLKNALSMEGLNMSTEENNEVVVPIQFMAHADETDITSGKAGVTIYWPKEVQA
jgi:hypothetical protein